MNKYERPLADVSLLSTEDVMTLSKGGQYDDESNSISWDKLTEGMEL